MIILSTILSKVECFEYAAAQHERGCERTCYTGRACARRDCARRAPPLAAGVGAQFGALPQRLTVGAELGAAVGDTRQRSVLGALRRERIQDGAVVMVGKRSDELA